MKPQASIGVPALVLSALLLELTGAIPLFATGTGVTSPLLFYAGLHLLAAVIVALTLFRLFPETYQRPAAATAVTLFAIACFIPFLGIPGMLTGLATGLYTPRKERPETFNTVSIPDLPYKPLNVNAQPLFGSSGLAGVIQNAPDPEKRVRAVMATRQLRDKDAIPILRIALRDPVDDVRLLAYSLLDGKEQKINERIKQLSGELESAQGRVAGQLHEQLAAQYWELAYLGLASGDVYEHVLRQALGQIEAAERLLAEDAGLLFQKGRILLRLHRLDEAEAALHRARTLGMSEVDVNPYLAEVAYLRRNWRQVREFLSALDPMARSEPPISLIADYWTTAP